MKKNIVKIEKKYLENNIDGIIEKILKKSFIDFLL